MHTAEADGVYLVVLVVVVSEEAAAAPAASPMMLLVLKLPAVLHKKAFRKMLEEGHDEKDGIKHMRFFVIALLLSWFEILVLLLIFSVMVVLPIGCNSVPAWTVVVEFRCCCGLFDKDDDVVDRLFTSTCSSPPSCRLLIVTDGYFAKSKDSKLDLSYSIARQRVSAKEMKGVGEDELHGVPGIGD
eukprot:scaffold3648_cov98-Cylindrotheca_fusiformis.AAC.3